MKKLRYFTMLWFVCFFLASCWSGGGEDLKPNKTILKYELKKVNDPALKPGQLHGAISSLNGDWIYLVGKEKASLVAYDVNKKKYEEAIGDFKGLRNAKDRTLVGDLSTHRVLNATPGFDGLLFTLSD